MVSATLLAVLSRRSVMVLLPYVRFPSGGLKRCKKLSECDSILT